MVDFSNMELHGVGVCRSVELGVKFAPGSRNFLLQAVDVELVVSDFALEEERVSGGAEQS